MGFLAIGEREREFFLKAKKRQSRCTFHLKTLYQFYHFRCFQKNNPKGVPINKTKIDSPSPVGMRIDAWLVMEYSSGAVVGIGSLGVCD
jgi:hypothetical protein